MAPNITIMNEQKITIDSLNKCSRCGGDHKSITFEKLERPLGNLTHFAMCPTNNQPIMMTIEENNEGHA